MGPGRTGLEDLVWLSRHHPHRGRRPGRRPDGAASAHPSIELSGWLVLRVRPPELYRRHGLGSSSLRRERRQAHPIGTPEGTQLWRRLVLVELLVTGLLLLGFAVLWWMRAH